MIPLRMIHPKSYTIVIVPFLLGVGTKTSSSYLKLTLSVFQVDLVLVLVNQTRCHFQMHLNMERLDRVFPDSSLLIVSDDF